MPENIAVELNQVTKSFSDPENGRPVIAADRVSFSVPEGEMVTLLGPSGCGKTTILRMIGGFEVPDTGSIAIQGRDMNGIPPHRRPTAMVFQTYALFPHITVFNNIAYGLRVRKLPAPAVREKVLAAMKTMGLESLGGRFPGQLSGGQQQRVAVCRAIVTEPKVLLFDEPLSNLDARLRVRMRNEIRSLQKRLGIAAVYVTHDQEEAMAISDRIIIMNMGRIEQSGAPREVYERPVSKFVADFFGLVNFIPARVKESREPESVTVNFADRDFVIRGRGLPEVKPGGAVAVVARPETISLGGDGGSDALLCEVSHLVYLGSVIEYEVDLNGIRLKVTQRDPGHGGVLSIGDKTPLRFNPSTFHILPE